MRPGDFLLGAIRDPQTRDASSARIAGLAAIIAGITIAFLHPDRAATVTALVGGGAVPFLTRNKPSTGMSSYYGQNGDDASPADDEP